MVNLYCTHEKYQKGTLKNIWFYVLGKLIIKRMSLRLKHEKQLLGIRYFILKFGIIRQNV